MFRYGNSCCIYILVSLLLLLLLLVITMFFVLIFNAMSQWQFFYNQCQQCLMHSPSPFTNIPSPLALFPDTLLTFCGCKGSRFVFHFRFSTSSSRAWSWPSTGFGGEQGHTLDDPGQFVLGKQEMRMKWSGTKFLLDDAVHFNSCRWQRLEVKWLDEYG